MKYPSRYGGQHQNTPLCPCVACLKRRIESRAARGAAFLASLPTGAAITLRIGPRERMGSAHDVTFEIKREEPTE